MEGDAELVLAARSGDDAAFASVYDRYSDRIHDFCHSILRDRHEAADAMQDTFVLASQRLTQLREPEKLRSWLFAIARHEALRRAKARGRAIPTEDAGVDVAAAAPSTEDVVSGRDAGTIVWEAAAGLSDRDRVLLDLHVRQGLDGQELADAIGTTPGHAYVLMNRLREQVERSIGALLVARLGREDCDELQRVLEGWDGKFSPLWRKRVARHVDDCDVCSERRRAFLSPLSLLGAIPLVPAPLALRELTLDQVRHASSSRPEGAWRSPSARGGFPPPMVDGHRRRLVAAAVAAGLLVGGGLGLTVLDDGRGGGRERVVASERRGPTTSSTSTSTTLPVPAPAVAPTTTVPRPTAAPPPPPPPPDTTGPSVGAAPAVACSSAAQGSVTINATAADPSGIASVTLTASGPNHTSHTPTMSGGGGAYTGSISWTGLGTISFTVTATDASGNPASTSGSFPVFINCVP